VAVITGAGSGIGRATAERFVEEGAKVVIAEINDELGEAAAASARALAGNSTGISSYLRLRGLLAVTFRPTARLP